MAGFDQIRGLGARGVAAPRARAVRPSLNFGMLCLLLAACGTALHLGLYPGSPLTFVFVLVGWIVSLCLHEFAHAYVAWRGGDAGQAGTGYLTLDPVRYANPVLSVLMPVVFLLAGGLAFPGGCVYIDRSRLRGPRWEAAVSAAGPLANLAVLAAIAAAFALGFDADSVSALWPALAMLAFVQAAAVILNLLPVPGLDGYGILAPFLPTEWRRAGDRAAGAGLLLLTFLFLAAPGLGSTLAMGGARLAVLSGIDLWSLVQGVRAFRFWA